MRDKRGVHLCHRGAAAAHYEEELALLREARQVGKRLGANGRGLFHEHVLASEQHAPRRVVVQRVDVAYIHHVHGTVLCEGIVASVGPRDAVGVGEGLRATLGAGQGAGGHRIHLGTHAIQRRGKVAGDAARPCDAPA